MKNKLRPLLFLAVIPAVASSSGFVTKDGQRYSKVFGSKGIRQNVQVSTSSNINPYSAQTPKFKPLRLPKTAPDLPLKKKKARFIGKKQAAQMKKVAKYVCIGLGVWLFIGFIRIVFMLRDNNWHF